MYADITLWISVIIRLVQRNANQVIWVPILYVEASMVTAAQTCLPTQQLQPFSFVHKIDQYTCTCYGLIHNLTGFEAGWPNSWLKLICWPTLKPRGTVAENEHNATQHKCTCAVAIALQSWCLIKRSHGLLLWNCNLTLKTVSNGTFAEIVEGWLSPPSTCCTVAIAVLHHVG